MGTGLGQNADICVDTFVEAMRRTLSDEDRPKLDRPEVRAGLEPLGAAVFDIAVGPAQTRADDATDREFWTWVGEVARWMEAMEAWRQDLVEAFAETSPSRGALHDLADRVREAEPPPPPPRRAPRSLTGLIR